MKHDAVRLIYLQLSQLRRQPCGNRLLSTHDNVRTKTGYTVLTTATVILPLKNKTLRQQSSDLGLSAVQTGSCFDMSKHGLETTKHRDVIVTNVSSAYVSADLHKSTAAAGDKHYLRTPTFEAATPTEISYRSEFLKSTPHLYPSPISERPNDSHRPLHSDGYRSSPPDISKTSAYKTKVNGYRSIPDYKSPSEAYRTLLPDGYKPSLDYKPKMEGFKLSLPDGYKISPTEGYSKLSLLDGYKKASPAEKPYDKPSPTSDSYIKLSPMNGYDRPCPSEHYKKLSPMEGYRKISPTESYKKLSPVDGYKKSPLEGYRTFPSPSDGYTKLSPTDAGYKISPTAGYKSINDLYKSRLDSIMGATYKK